jgi:alcohol dehydrogenase class IV
MFRVRRALPPLYAVPTTAGTGSEATLAAVVTDDRHRKRMVGDLALIPRAAVLDPLLTVGMPPRVTAASGMDALCHAVEAFIGRSNTRTTRQNAIAAVRLIFADLERAYRDGGDLEARFGMQQAAYRAGLAFTRANVGYVHAVAHALGGRYGIAHGACCAVAMPAVLRAYGEKAHVALAALADAAGVTQGSASAQQTSNKAEALIRAIES